MRHKATPSSRASTSATDIAQSRSASESVNESTPLNDTDSEVECSITGRSEFRKLLQQYDNKADIERLYPRSLWPGSSTKFVANEKTLLESIVAADGAEDGSQLDTQSFLSIGLTDFCIYRSLNHPKEPGQMQVIQEAILDNDFLIDGLVVMDQQQHYMQGIPIHLISIEGYSDRTISTTADKIWLQSQRGVQNDLWYILQSPATEYAENWITSIWVTDLAKHFVDYLEAAGDRSVRLSDFSAGFIKSLSSWYGQDPNFLSWRRSCADVVDLRRHIARHAKFLLNQAFTTADMGTQTSASGIFKHEIWDEICPGLRNAPTQSKKEEHTVVTQNVANCFLRSFPGWAKDGLALFDVVEPCEAAVSFTKDRVRNHKLPDKFAVDQAGHFREVPGEGQQSLAAMTLEDVATQRSVRCQPKTNPESLKNKLVIVGRLCPKAKSTDEIFQYALVSGISQSKNTLQVVWMLHPGQTQIIDRACYPIGNELFFSSECNCEEVRLTSVYRIFDISQHSDCAKDGAKFFARELFVSSTKKGGPMFATAINSQLRCECKRKRPPPVTAQYPDPVQGWARPRQIQTLSLFSGCGLLDWALEESSGMHTVVAIDYDECAAASHRVNQIQNTSNCRSLQTSINSYLRDCLEGREPIMEVDNIAAGTSCTGFSGINGFKETRKSQKNCSLVAGTIAYIELFRPMTFLMENVPRINSGPSPNVYQQTVACLVSLGYQVQTWVLDSSQYGQGQKRERLFIVAVAGSFPNPNVPPRTHGDRGLLPTRTASQAVGALPSIHNETTVNLTHPDHIPVGRLRCDFKTVNRRLIVQKIPKSPAGMNLAKTLREGLLNPRQRRWAQSLSEEQLRDRSPTLRRIDPNLPFPTITASISPMWGRSAPSLHWQDDRVVSLEEYKRGMGVPIDKVLIGPPREQMKQTGNGVPFQLGMAVGKQIGQSWDRWYYWQELIAKNKQPSGEDHVQLEKPSNRGTSVKKQLQAPNHFGLLIERMAPTGQIMDTSNISAARCAPKMKSSEMADSDDKQGNRTGHRRKRKRGTRIASHRCLVEDDIGGGDDDDISDDSDVLFVRERSVAKVSDWASD